MNNNIYLQKMALKKGVKECVKGFDLTDCFGVTLTLKQRVSNQSIDEIISSTNFKHFMNFLNNKCFGNAFRRFNKRISVFPILEKSSDGRYHYHIIIRNPFTENPHKFEKMIESSWFETSYGYRHIHMHQKIDKGWGDYITKFNNSDDTVDWINYSS